MKFKKFLLLLLLTIILLSSGVYGEVMKPKVYLIVANKITLKDIKSMEKVQAIIQEGTIGLMNTRGSSGYGGAQGFLTINASEKTHAKNSNIEVYQEGRTIKTKPYELSRINDWNKDNRYSPNIGAIGDNLHQAGLKTAIYGNSNLANENINFAALIPMDSKGLIDFGNIVDITVDKNEYPFDIKTNYFKLLDEIKNSSGDFIVVDLGDLERIYRSGANLSKEEYGIIRSNILNDIDSFMGEIIKEIDLDNSLLIILSPNDGDYNVDSSKLSPIIVTGKGMGAGTLISSTTNRENIVSNLDIGPTAMEFLGASRKGMSGKSIENIDRVNNLENIIDENQRINTISKVRYKTLLYYGIVSIIVLILPLIFVILRIRMSKKIKKIINLLLTMLLVTPSILIIGSFLKPNNILGYSINLTGLLLLGFFTTWITRNCKDQVFYISGFTISLIFLDLILKGSISRYSVLSHDPIIGARYYGIGNEMVGLLLGSTIIFSKRLIEKFNNLYIPLIIFIIALGLIGNPNMGANVGGTLAFTIAIIVYIMEILEINLNHKRTFLIVIFIGLTILLIGLFDISFNENTTHLGNTILLIKDNGLSKINDIIIRKVLMNIKLIGSSFWTYLLLIHMFSHFILFGHYEKKDDSSLKISIAGMVGIISGFILNDSGIILAAIAMNMITLELYTRTYN